MKEILRLTLITLVIVLASSKQSFIDYGFRLSEQKNLQKLQQSQCSYGGGLINNSTVIQLQNCGQLIYSIVLGIGTPAQYFTFQFDTGSPTLWIPLGNPPSGFNQSNSSTYSLNGQPGYISYADGSSVSGNMGNEIVTVNGTILRINGSILFGTTVSQGIFLNYPQINGLVGMDFKSTQNSQFYNFLYLAYLNNQISTPVFALDLDFMNGTSYLYYNGGIPSYALGNSSWVNQSIQPGQASVQYWMVDVLSVSLNGVNFSNVAAPVAVIDSGTSLFILNQAFYNSVVQQYFSTSQCYTNSTTNLINCYCNSTWPSFTFGFNGAQVFIPTESYKIANTDNPEFCFEVFTSTTENQIILGDVFFRNYIITFDSILKRIGFYLKTPLMINFDPKYFIYSQYAACALFGIGWIVGLILLIKSKMQDLGKELM